MMSLPLNYILFPYTTLFRSALLEQGDYVSAMAAYDEFLKKYPDDRLAGSVQARRDTASRSEEHTSELQSLTNLVCRLLLEKKTETGKQAGDAIQIIL